MKKRKTRLEVGAVGGPVDWAAWEKDAVRPRGFRYGSKHTPEDRAKISKAVRAYEAEQRRKLAEALAAARAANPPVRQEVLPVPQFQDKVFGLCEPGKWYARRDIVNLTGHGPRSVMPAVLKWWREGYFVRCPNPDWKPPAYPGAHQGPQWLFKLSEKGEQRHRLAATLL